jgi:hypothetical protein
MTEDQKAFIGGYNCQNCCRLQVDKQGTFCADCIALFERIRCEREALPVELL